MCWPIGARPPPFPIRRSLSRYSPPTCLPPRHLCPRPRPPRHLVPAPRCNIQEASRTIAEKALSSKAYRCFIGSPCRNIRQARLRSTVLDQSIISLPGMTRCGERPAQAVSGVSEARKGSQEIVLAACRAFMYLSTHLHPNLTSGSCNKCVSLELCFEFLDTY